MPEWAVGCRKMLSHSCLVLTSGASSSPERIIPAKTSVIIDQIGEMKLGRVKGLGSLRSPSLNSTLIPENAF